MFLDNKYRKWYDSIISNAQARVNCESDYSEVHHRVPRSLGGSDSLENLVKLTAREHFICHLLLTKMTEGKAKRSMCFAMWAISKLRHKYLHPIKLNSHTFATIRKNYAEQVSIGKRGIPRSKETREAISKSHLGKVLSTSHKTAISVGSIGRIVTNDTRDKISKIHKGKILSTETKSKIGKSSEGRKQSGWFKWILKDPSGNIHEILCLRDFCKNNNLPWKSISQSLNTGPVFKGVAKGWCALSKERP